MSKTAAEIQEALAEPFPAESVDWKPQTAKGGRALAVAYIDARCVMERLDAVVGTAGWQDEYHVLDDGNMVCKLSVNVAGEWVTKMDVGSVSDQKDVGDKRKAAFSDALKRAAVKFGIGRYLYSLPHQWCDYDEQRRQFKSTPRLPDWALPRQQPRQEQRPQAPQQPKQAPQQQAQPPKPTMTGERFLERLKEKEAGFVKEGLCKPDELVAHVAAAGVKAGWSAKIHEWTGKAIDEGIACARQFETDRRADAPGLAPDRLEIVVLELQQQIDDATPEQLGALEASLQEQAKDLGRKQLDELLRRVREKRLMAPQGKGRKAKAG